jgi:hypothetical protein
VQLVHIIWLYILRSGPLATSTADANAVDNVTLLGLVAETAGLVGARRAAGTVDDLELAKLLMHSQLSSTSNINQDPKVSRKSISYLPALSKVSGISSRLQLSNTYANAHQEAHHVRLLLLLKLLDILEGTHLG